MKKLLLSAFFGFTLLADAADPILRIGANTNDLFFSSFWAQKNNASNAVAGINANSPIRFSSNLIPTNVAYLDGAALTNLLQGWLRRGSNMTFVTNADGSLTISSSGGGGGSQTPWESDIDAAQYSLTNAVVLQGGRMFVWDNPTNALAITNMMAAPRHGFYMADDSFVVAHTPSGFRFYSVTNHVADWASSIGPIDIDAGGSAFDMPDYNLYIKGVIATETRLFYLSVGGINRMYVDPDGDTLLSDSSDDVQLSVSTNGVKIEGGLTVDYSVVDADNYHLTPSNHYVMFLPTNSPSLVYMPTNAPKGRVVSIKNGLGGNLLQLTNELGTVNGTGYVSLADGSGSGNWVELIYDGTNNWNMFGFYVAP